MIALDVFAILFGLCIGSFLNVIILRLPHKEDVIFKRSHCTSCNKQIAWFENIPVVSYLLLRGKCGNCHVKISPQYPLVELLIGFMSFYFLKDFARSGDSYHLALYFFKLAVFCAFIAIFLIDMRHKIIPDVLNFYLGVVFLTFICWQKPVSFWLVGGLIGFAIPLGITYLFYFLKGQIGLGGGDIKLYGVLGIYLGAYGVYMNLFLSCLLGSVVILSLMALKIVSRETKIPFGPFIVSVAFVQIFFPDYFSQVTKIFLYS